MSALCTGCTVSAIPQDYFNCVNVFRRIGAKYFVLVKCDYQFTDITSAAEWTAARTAGNVVCSPPGDLTWATANFTTFDTDKCGGKAVGDITWPIDFTTYQVAADLSDFTWWEALYNGSAGWRLMTVDCNDIWTVSDAYATGTTSAGNNPGLPFSITALPNPQEGEAKNAQWVTQFEVAKEGLIKRRFLPGVAAAICG
jgi:hypothetical protein